jgi:hypothetical protein
MTFRETPAPSHRTASSSHKSHFINCKQFQTAGPLQNRCYFFVISNSARRHYESDCDLNAALRCGVPARCIAVAKRRRAAAKDFARNACGTGNSRLDWWDVGTDATARSGPSLVRRGARRGRAPQARARSRRCRGCTASRAALQRSGLERERIRGEGGQAMPPLMASSFGEFRRMSNRPRALSLQVESDSAPKSLFLSMILSEKSATFRDHALAGRD